MSQVLVRMPRACGGELLGFDCPGCGFFHQVAVGDGPGPRWDWNGSMDRPTFAPSLLVTGVHRLTDDEHQRLMAGERIEPRPLCCHSFVRDGMIQFLGDCTHEHVGQTMALVPEADG